MLYYNQQRELSQIKEESELTREEIINALEEMDNGQLLSLHNEYCVETNHYDDIVSYNDECFFSENFSDTMQAVRAVCYGDYNYTHTFVMFNGYGNLKSSDYLPELIDNEELADWLEEMDEEEQESKLY